MLRGGDRGIYTLREAATRGELVMYYQPKVDMTTGLTIGVEALMRWRHPTLGLLSPAMFDDAIKSGSEITIDLGCWAIQAAIKQISDWKKHGLSIPISVNVMASELTEGDFYAWLREALEQHTDVCPTMLELEIVESSSLSDPKRVTDVISKCRTAGVKFALDDFGTAYSSLSYVRDIPSDHIKIDKSFVRDIIHNHQDQGLVQTVIALAHSFDCKVIAEGVESIEHGLVLMELGCKYAQGFAIARPMQATEVPAWVKQYKGHPEWMAGCLVHETQAALL